jgi:trehalose 6-phosphate phosphatase
VTRSLPSALEALPHIGERIAGRQTMVFLDYDGTLTPIVRRPEQAVMSEEMRDRLRDLVARVPVAIVSGRDRATVEELVGLPELVYVGSHGFDVAGPEGSGLQLEVASDYVPDLDAAEAALRGRLAGIRGALVERKRLTLAAHYRLVAGVHRAKVAEAVEAVRAAHPRLRRDIGKAVFELRPDVEWDKGHAVRWLVDRMVPDGVPLYIGDDLTDETAFAALRGRGIGIAVGVSGRETLAELALRDPDEVGSFLHRLASLVGNGVHRLA